MKKDDASGYLMKALESNFERIFTNTLVSEDNPQRFRKALQNLQAAEQVAQDIIKDEFK